MNLSKWVHHNTRHVERTKKKRRRRSISYCSLLYMTPINSYSYFYIYRLYNAIIFKRRRTFFFLSISMMVLQKTNFFFFVHVFLKNIDEEIWIKIGYFPGENYIKNLHLYNIKEHVLKHWIGIVVVFV